MKNERRFLLSMRKAWDALFNQDLSLKHGGAGLRVTLEDRSATQGAAATPEELQRRKTAEALRLMLAQLGELLDERPENRRTKRFLVFIERALMRHGLRALRELPLEILERCLAQLEEMVVNWSPVGLAALRSKMAVAVIERAAEPPRETAQPTYATTVPTELADDLPTVEEMSDEASLAAIYAGLGGAAQGAEVARDEGAKPEGGDGARS